MKRLLTLSTWIDALNERLGWIADWLVLLSCLISAGNAFSRYAFSISSKRLDRDPVVHVRHAVMLGASYTAKAQRRRALSL